MLRSRLVREGSVGLFLLLGLLVLGGIIFFLKGTPFQKNSYKVKLQFGNAGGLTNGGKVLYRGVEVGKIVEIQPSTNGIEVIAEINSKLPIPDDVRVSTIKSGLLGEVSVDLSPLEELDEKAETINPLSKDCLEKKLVLCNNQVIKGKSSPDLIATLTRLSEIYSDPALFDNINNAVANVAEAGNKAAELSEDLSTFMEEVKEDINNVSEAANKFQQTADAITNTATVATEQINSISEDFRKTSGEINILATNLNGIIDNNKTNINDAIINLSATTKEVSTLAKNADSLISKLDKSLTANDIQKLVSNLETATANFEKISDDLLAISTEINNPANLVALQQTLDSARVTFANTAKITSDLDELTGDPQFRSNMRKLVDGLSNLVSYTELIEKQVELAIALDSAQQITDNNSPVKFSQFQPTYPPNLNRIKNTNNLPLESNNFTQVNQNKTK